MSFSRILTLPLAAGIALALAGVAPAQETGRNHLDCYFASGSSEMQCPSAVPVQTGRAATSDGGGITAQRGTPQWNQACAAKFRSFNPQTGTYRAFSGEERPCS